MVGCGKCKACRNRRTTRWISRLQDESRCWRYTFELYLDYNDKYLPSFDFSANGDVLVERQSRFYKCPDKSILSIPLSDFDNLDDADSQYFIDRLNQHYTAIPHPSVRDIQLFKKRLNKYIYELSGTYKSFRSAIAAEIGPTTFRPHYHGVLFFNDPRLSSKITGLVYKAWSDGCGHSLGHAYAKPDRGGITSYVAKYICRPTDLPQIYSHPALRPFFLTSRNPPIGSLFQSESEVRKIFFDANPQITRVILQDGKYSPRAFPLSPTIENRLFPKCPLYGEISPTCRIELYKSVIGVRGLLSDFDDYIQTIMSRINYYPLFSENNGTGFPDHIGQCRPSQFADLICAVTHNFESVDSLRPLHRLACRIYFQSEVFGVSFDFYINQIFKYYDRKELLKLKSQYQFQKEYRYNPSELQCMYQFATPPDSFRETSDYKAFFKDTCFKYDEARKTLKKNAYFESLKVKDTPLYKLVKNYYYGKECHETIEALG